MTIISLPYLEYMGHMEDMGYGTIKPKTIYESKIASATEIKIYVFYMCVYIYTHMYDI